MTRRRCTLGSSGSAFWLAVLVSCVSAAADARPRRTKESLGPSILRATLTEKAAERGILSPVPVRIELPQGMPAVRVLVHYRLWGNRHWTTLELTRRGAFWEGAIPCLQVSTVTGDLVYYIRVHDREGAVLAYSASRAKPYRVRIVHPSASRSAKRARCPDPSDCPPGLPGCPSERLARVPCESDADCEGGLECGWDGYCESIEREMNWMSLELEQGAGIVATAGACSVPSQENEGYACYRRTDGENYLGNPVYTNEPLRAGLAPLRVLVGFERVVFYGSTLGVRAGYAVAREGPTLPEGTPFFPLSLEIRAAHWFGSDPFAVAGWRPYVYAVAGAAMFDVPVTIRVREDPSARSFQGGNDLEQNLDAWKRAGDAYVGAGAGAMWAISRGGGPSLELGVVQAFPFGATLVLPRLGYRVGF